MAETLSGSSPFVAAKIDLLIRAGASVTARDYLGKTPLDLAISQGYSAGLLDLSDDYIKIRRIYPALLAAGAALPTSTYGDAYLQRVMAAGSFANYARRHLDTLTLMLTPRRGPSSPLRLVPHEVLRKISAFAFHVGYY
jgi:ankyrin repeat protein